MTQKEYREKIKQYEDEIAELRIKLEKAEDTQNTGVEALKLYYVINEELRSEKRYNEMNIQTMETQRKLIDQYEKILGRITINEG